MNYSWGDEFPSEHPRVWIPAKLVLHIIKDGDDVQSEKDLMEGIPDADDILDFSHAGSGFVPWTGSIISAMNWSLEIVGLLLLAIIAFIAMVLYVPIRLLMGWK